MWSQLHQQELKLPPWPPQICTVVDMIELQLLDQTMKFSLLLPACDNGMNCFFLFFFRIFKTSSSLLDVNFIFPLCIFWWRFFFFFFAKKPKIFSTYIAYTTGFFKKKGGEFHVTLLQCTQCVMTLKGEFRGHSLLTFLPWWCLTTRKSGQHDREVVKLQMCTCKSS